LVKYFRWGEENEELDGGDYVVKQYKKAEEIAVYGLTMEGRERRQSTLSKTNPYTVLRSGRFWLGYGLAIDRLLMRQKNGEEMKYEMDQGPTQLDSREKYLLGVAVDPTMAEGHYRLSKLETTAEQAHARLDLALEHSGRKMVDALFAKGNLHYKNGHDVLAIPLYLEAITFQPMATDLRINCALAYRNAGEYEKSIQMARSILEIDSFHKKAGMLVDELTESPSAEEE
jgi:tetratricopeptide (TPR) repeat protein